MCTADDCGVMRRLEDAAGRDDCIELSLNPSPSEEAESHVTTSLQEIWQNAYDFTSWERIAISC